MVLVDATATHLTLTVQPDRLELLPGRSADVLAYVADPDGRTLPTGPSWWPPAAS